SATASSLAQVAEAPLSVATLNASAVEGTASGPLTLATFADAGGPEDPSEYQASVDWGDGSPAAAATVSYDPASGRFSVSASHVYAEEGSYTAHLTISHGGLAFSAASPVAVADAPLSLAAVLFQPV